ncbi:PD-(D/E)XK nuclease family protein [Arenibacter algicola]|uniref:PD-(D/E)XK nuclease superfamily protein n=1 Tax=Arenibacter algicola TaxID=616991 RepID=A0A221UUW9_9FLAO|nr:PD-(D/E)XK nuclease family protein [Arenibacter algicola]ASO05102.1 PD-(D/E)XK nuclease superfamily protein [Arenibacter algicola]
MISPETIDFINDIESIIPVFKKDPVTSLSISGYPHYENVISNWFAYFLGSNGEHQLKNLFSEAFQNCLSKKNVKADLSWLKSSVEAYREVYTKKGHFIDIVVYDEYDGTQLKYKNALIIEHKIYADLYNDLDDYYNSIEVEKCKIGIILSAKKRTDNHLLFVNVSYAEILIEIQELLGHYQLQADYKHIIYVTDLLNTMNAHSDNQTNEEIDFCFEHGAKILELEDIKANAINKLLAQLKSTVQGEMFRYKSTPAYSFVIESCNVKSFITFYYQSLFKDGHCLFKYWLDKEVVQAFVESTNKDELQLYCKSRGFEVFFKNEKNNDVIIEGTFNYDSKSGIPFPIKLNEFLETQIAAINRIIQKILISNKQQP